MFQSLATRKEMERLRQSIFTENELTAWVSDYQEKWIHADPHWICCCQLPSNQPPVPGTAEYNSMCIFQPNTFYWQRSMTVGEMRKVSLQDAYLHKKDGCICKARAIDHPDHPFVLTVDGFDRAHGARSSMAKVSVDFRDEPLTTPNAVRKAMAILEDPIRDCQFKTMNVVPRPFRLWPLVEHIAWFTNDSSFDISKIRDGEERAQMVALIGTMLLTVVNVLISQELFTTQNTPIMRNLSLTLALFLKFGDVVDREEICPSNENGWAWVVLCLAEERNVDIQGVDGIDIIIKTIREKGTELDARRSRQRGNWWLREQWGLMRLPTEKEVEEYAANEGQPPCKRGTGTRRKWLLEDDYDPDGLRYWKRWNLQDEYKLYLKDSAKRKRGKQPKITTATRFTKKPAQRMKILD